MAKKKVDVVSVDSGLDDAAMKKVILNNLFTLYNQASQDCIKNGCVQTLKSGFEQVRPQYVAMNALLEKIMTFMPGYEPPKDGKKEVNKPGIPGRPRKQFITE